MKTYRIIKSLLIASALMLVSAVGFSQNSQRILISGKSCLYEFDGQYFIDIHDGDNCRHQLSFYSKDGARDTIKEFISAFDEAAREHDYGVISIGHYEFSRVQGRGKHIVFIQDEEKEWKCCYITDRKFLKKCLRKLN